MENIYYYWLTVLIFATQNARYTELSYSIRDWARILMSKPTILEAANNPIDKGIVNFQEYRALSEEDMKLIDILNPPKLWIKEAFSLYGGLITIAISFIWFPWYIPALAILCHLVIIPVLIKPLTTGARHGHKKKILKGLESKMKMCSQINEIEECEAYKKIYHVLSNSVWRIRKF